MGLLQAFIYSAAFLSTLETRSSNHELCIIVYLEERQTPRGATIELIMNFNYPYFISIYATICHPAIVLYTCYCAIVQLTSPIGL